MMKSKLVFKARIHTFTFAMGISVIFVLSFSRSGTSLTYMEALAFTVTRILGMWSISYQCRYGGESTNKKWL